MDVRTESHPDEECRALAGILIRIGDKRTVMVVRALSRGSMRYSEIFKLVDGVSQRMLTLTLKSLEREGLVHSDNVPDEDYALIERGQTLIVPLHGLWTWPKANREAIEDTRREFDQRRRPRLTA